MQKWWSVFFGVVLLASLALWVVARYVGWWMPPLANADGYGTEIDKLYYLIEGFTGFFFVLTEVILVVAMWRFAGKPGQRATYVHGNHKLEMAWTIVPAGILLFIAFVQIGTWADIKYTSRMKPPQQIIEVSARQFEWRVRYPDKGVRARATVPENTAEWTEATKIAADGWGHDTLKDFGDLHLVNEIHTWKGANTRVYLKTRDVLHSFFLPNMRLKQDAVPGKTIPVWFRPDDHNGHFDTKKKAWVYERDEQDKEKIWELACAELCGWGHYKMQGRLYVHEDQKSYDAWLEYALSKQRATAPEK